MCNIRIFSYWIVRKGRSSKSVRVAASVGAGDGETTAVFLSRTRQGVVVLEGQTRSHWLISHGPI